jgi:murein DD-endopeptidase MepM/ murein hydrolase activator NlpD
MSRSTDSVDAPTSVTLPLATSVTPAFGWRSDPFTGESRFHQRHRSPRRLRHRGAGCQRGTVVCAGERGSYGSLAVVRDEQGIETCYAHLPATLVKEGDVITPGTRVGRVGSSGRSAAPHLHFEVLVKRRTC